MGRDDVPPIRRETDLVFFEPLGAPVSEGHDSQDVISTEAKAVRVPLKGVENDEEEFTALLIPADRRNDIGQNIALFSGMAMGAAVAVFTAKTGRADRAVFT